MSSIKKFIDNQAYLIAQTLHRAGFLAYFAGGWVRDYLLGLPSSDIDIATNAQPEQIKSLFDKTVAVGESFGVMVVLLQGRSYEVATFRRDLPYLDGRHPAGVVAAQPQEDAMRRDFTINGMFYDPFSEQIIDYVQGQEDLKNRLLRAIGKPQDRFQEDRLRMLRAVRFAATLDFAMEKETFTALQTEAGLLFPSVAIERVCAELRKMATTHEVFVRSIDWMQKSHLLPVIFPQLAGVASSDIQKRVQRYHPLPDQTPLLCYLLRLFDCWDEKIIDWLAEHFKMPKKERQLAHLVLQALSLRDEDRYSWSYFLAGEEALKALSIAAAFREDRDSFLKRSQKKVRHLALHIERIKQKKPLVTSDMLRKQGIEPGPHMGKLLKIAELLVIEKNLLYPEDALRLLKRSSFWLHDS